MAIAMKDLEIRGAGNLLGGEQSGHIADVGFDLYVRLVGEAVHEFRGDAEPELAEVRIELPVDAHLPHELHPLRAAPPGDVQAAGRGPLTDEDVDQLRDEMVDRYGDAARRGHLAAAGGPVPGPGPPGRRRRGHHLREVRPVRAGRAARVARGPAAADVPQERRQGAR